MASEAQRTAAKKNIKKVSAVGKEKKAIAHLPQSTRTALGKQRNKVRRAKQW
jgi:hypothetical protein